MRAFLLLFVLWAAPLEAQAIAGLQLCEALNAAIPPGLVTADQPIQLAWRRDGTLAEEIRGWTVTVDKTVLQVGNLTPVPCQDGATLAYQYTLPSKLPEGLHRVEVQAWNYARTCTGAPPVCTDTTTRQTAEPVALDFTLNVTPGGAVVVAPAVPTNLRIK